MDSSCNRRLPSCVPAFFTSFPFNQRQSLIVHKQFSTNFPTNLLSEERLSANTTSVLISSSPKAGAVRRIVSAMNRIVRDARNVAQPSSYRRAQGFAQQRSREAPSS